MKYALLLFLFCASCADLKPGIYNIDADQDKDCYAQFGGKHGYCDMVYTRNPK